jgi:hypothetical protein
MKFKNLLVLAALVWSHFVFATDDPYNTFLWNRENAMAANGAVDEDPWYEWWYYKIVDPASDRAFFFTYGVINPWDVTGTMAGTKAVVQAGDFKNKILVDKIFPVADFRAAYDKTEVEMDGNTATDRQVKGHIVANGHDVAWDFSLVKEWQFNAMGWTREMAGTSGIYWYPAQASALATGWIAYDGNRYEFNSAPAYQDRNWGDSFPKWWTWLTSNHFVGSPGTALAVGGGQPKLFNSVYFFKGLCIGLKHEGEDYIFRSTDLDDVSFTINWGKWEVTAENGNNQRIEISAFAPPEKFMMLPFGSPDGNTFYDYEALTGHMTVKLYTRSSVFASWKLVADLVTEHAGIEWGTPEPVGSLSLFNLFQGSTVLFKGQAPAVR